MPDSGTLDFQMIFPPLPKNVTEMNFPEGDFPGSFSIWGIRLDGKQTAVSVMGDINQDEKTVLETTGLKPGTALLHSKLLNYSPSMNMNGMVYVSNLITSGVGYEAIVGERINQT